MSSNILFTDSAWKDYVYWQKTDKKILKRINELLKDCQRSAFEGVGKPEPLRGELSGFYSRRIDKEHRLVYRYEKMQIEIIACRYHY